MRRGRAESYFPEIPGSPPPLSAEVSRKVRFEELDPLGIVWHGRYPSYLEDGRVAFGEKHGLSYMLMRREKFIAPIVQMHIDYLSPLRFDDEFTIKAQLMWSEAVRLNFVYTITGPEGQPVAKGYTVQLLTNLDQEILLSRPDFVEELCGKWERGELS